MYNVRTWSTTSTHGSILMMSQGGKGIWRKNPILHARPSSSAAWNHKTRVEMKLNVLLHHFFLLLRFLYFCDLSIIRWKLWIMDFGDNLVQSKGRCHELSHVVNKKTGFCHGIPDLLVLAYMRSLSSLADWYNGYYFSGGFIFLFFLVFFLLTLGLEAGSLLMMFVRRVVDELWECAE